MQRDDLFTNIHKAIRAGLFELITTAGATDWNDPSQLDVFEEKWQRMHQLLDAHTRHEDECILRILDSSDPASTRAAAEQHRSLDMWLDEIANWVGAIVADPDSVRGLALYRELALFCADYLTHIHDEETLVMYRVWELCTDEDIAATRAAFMADTDPAVLDTSLRLLLPSIDPPARTALVAGIAARAPRHAVDTLVAIAHDVLEPDEANRLGEVASGAGVPA
jgi:hypothetical protein